MKFLGILIVAYLVHWNHSMASVLYSKDVALGPTDKAEKIVDAIVIKTQNPLSDLNDNLNSFSKLLKTFDEFKVHDVLFIHSLLEKMKNHDTLSGEELFVLRRTITVYYKINQKILDFAKVYDFGGFKMSKSFAEGKRNIPLVKSHLIWLTGHLVVLDHLTVMYNLMYRNDDVFRRIVKSAVIDKKTSEEGAEKTLNDLINMSKYTVEIGESLKFSQQINLVRGIQKELKVVLEAEPLGLLLIDEIMSNKTADEIVQGKTKFKLENFIFIDSFIIAYNKLTGYLSRIFGNIAGNVHWRKGHLYKHENAKIEAISHLEPMDVLFEKSPFILTDKLIPGHFGHVAVYLGTKEQLQKIQMWNHPSIVPYQESIANGKVILEAVRSGVRLTSLEEFLNVDELTIMTKVGGLSSPALLIEEITRGMDQIGKDYDFNFDITTLDKIVCSELIYITFGNVHWPTKYRLGRASITPDDVAEILFQKNTRFKIKNYMVAKSSRKIQFVNMSYIADEFDYELRSKDGSPIRNENDPTNSYWKKESKCYMVNDNVTNNPQRFCNTSYKEYQYEERDSI